MRPLTPAGQQLINSIAQRSGFSTDAVQTMLEAIVNGNGRMAQFNHGEFGGSGQWMAGGMLMLGDMFNHQLKGRVDSLCYELSNLVASQPDLLQSGSFQSQSQGNGFQQQGAAAPGAYSSSNSPNSLFVAPEVVSDWWGPTLRWPNSTGSQNNVRYAYFAQARRLAIEANDTVTIYDTLDHQIGGFGQQQAYGASLSFNSQYGLIDVGCLPVISVNGVAPVTPVSQPQFQPQAVAPAASANPAAETDIFTAIERLGQLYNQGILTSEEFTRKKAELLGRL